MFRQVSFPRRMSAAGNCILLLQIYETDGLPTQICQPCLENIDKFYTFKQKCIDSESELRKALKSMQRGKDKEEASELVTRQKIFQFIYFSLFIHVIHMVFIL